MMVYDTLKSWVRQWNVDSYTFHENGIEVSFAWSTRDQLALSTACRW